MNEPERATGRQKRSCDVCGHRLACPRMRGENLCYGAIARDEDTRPRQEPTERSEVMRDLIQKLSAAKGRRQALVDILVNDGATLLGSTIAYYATMNDAEDVLTMVGWSKSAMEMCKVIDKPIVYPLDETGMWGDAVRERKAIITNDYAGLQKPTKKGYPAGHVKVVRHMNAPIWDGDHIAGVFGVGNKPTDYTPEDAVLIVELGKAAWPIIRRAKE
jgi:hypothetical protein